MIARRKTVRRPPGENNVTKLEAFRLCADLEHAGNIDRVTGRDDAALIYETTSTNADVNLASKNALCAALEILGIHYRVRQVKDDTPTRKNHQYRITLTEENA